MCIKDSKGLPIEPRTLLYQLINNYSTFRDTLVLNWVQGDKQHSWEMKMENRIEATLVLECHIQLISELLLEKQNREIREREIRNQKLCGGWVDENGVIHGPMVELYASILNLRSAKVWVDLEATGEAITSILVETLKPQSDSTKQAVLLELQGRLKFFPPTVHLNEMLPYRQTSALLIPLFPCTLR